MKDKLLAARAGTRHDPDVGHPLLLVVLSILAFWSLLLTLIAGLYEVVNALEGIRTYLEKVTMGVRAIEQETRPLGEGLDQLAASLGAEGAALNAATPRLRAVARELGSVGRRVKSGE